MVILFLMGIRYVYCCYWKEKGFKLLMVVSVLKGKIEVGNW